MKKRKYITDDAVSLIFHIGPMACKSRLVASLTCVQGDICTFGVEEYKGMSKEQICKKVKEALIEVDVCTLDPESDERLIDEMWRL